MKPNIKVKASGVEYTDKLAVLVEKKIMQLVKLLPRSASDAVYEVELSKATKHHKSGKIYRAEINISYGSILHRAEDVAETLEIAIEIVKDELKTELSKTRGMKKEAARKGGRALKSMIRE